MSQALSNNTDDTTIVRNAIADITKDAGTQDRTGVLRAIIAEAQKALNEVAHPEGAYVVTLTHERYGIQRIGVDLDESESHSSLTDVALLLIERATRQAAGETITRDSYDADDEYENAVERRSKSFQVITIGRNTDAMRWRVTGSDKDGLFEIEIQAANKEDAEFQAQWDRSTNHFGMIQRSNVADFLSHLFEVKIADARLEPVTLRELYETIIETLGQGTTPAHWEPRITPGEGWVKLKAQIEKLVPLFEADPREIGP